MTEQAIIEKVNALLADEFEIEAAALTPEATLKDDLEFDSLDFVDIVVLIDSEFGFKPQEGELKRVTTLQDLYNYISAHVG